jgi:hypothetical protein
MKIGNVEWQPPKGHNTANPGNNLIIRLLSRVEAMKKERYTPHFIGPIMEAAERLAEYDNIEKVVIKAAGGSGRSGA